MTIRETLELTGEVVALVLVVASLTSIAILFLLLVGNMP